jgi:hypothetical protein
MLLSSRHSPKRAGGVPLSRWWVDTIGMLGHDQEMLVVPAVTLHALVLMEVGVTGRVMQGRTAGGSTKTDNAASTTRLPRLLRPSARGRRATRGLGQARRVVRQPPARGVSVCRRWRLQHHVDGRLL